MAVTAAFCPLSLDTLRDQNDARIVGGYIYVYAAGTTTLITTYADAGMVTANPNPLLSDGFGRIPPIYVGLGAYKIVAQDAGHGQLFTVDNLPGGVDYAAQAAAAAQAAGATQAQAQTGDIKFKHGRTSDAGWLVANGLTIGNTSTAASGRAAADTQALFVYLWNNDAALAVSGGRGATATADFNSGKTIALPDYRGRALAGCDQMGAAALAGNITSATTGAPDTVGTKIGAEGVTLTQAQLPAVTPTITIQNAGAHVHTATAANAGSHSHTGSTSTAGAHTHPFPATNEYNYSASGSGACNAGSFSSNTGSAGSHNHTISADGDHTHVLTVVSAGDHTHVATSSTFGSGQSHSNMPPAVLGFFHIKL